MDRDIYGPEIRQYIRDSLKALIGGEYSSHKEYPYLSVKIPYDMKTEIEGLPLYPKELPDILLQWAKVDRTTPWKKEDFLVLDLETTGLGRGETLAFLIGLGYFENEQFIVEQIFLPEPDAELHSFDRLAELLQSKSVFITFNGKTFDIPVLESRLLYNQIWLNLREKAHIDLLHMARRLWKNRAPNCALETLEYYILGHIRDAELDIDGSDIPQTYYQYLVNGDPELMRRIFVHNQYDILHTAALFALIGDSLSSPVAVGADHRIDYFAVAKLYQKESRKDEAKVILETMREQKVHSPELLLELGTIYKKEKQLDKALDCFFQGSELLHPECLLEEAKLLESHKKDYPQALIRCEQLVNHYLSRYSDHKKLGEISKRIERLQNKLQKAQLKSTKQPA